MTMLKVVNLEFYRMIRVVRRIINGWVLSSIGILGF
ncbi:hypothetical protein Golob_024881 [Gossypium lobatum]|uniref:Uncharacterized protein n=1 Tax=Gossypium lobatum TaxID=34289 RepID=A0A7J8NJG1_9ROSI|nr:hypothetical protein [Gossypium lobatum]